MIKRFKLLIAVVPIVLVVFLFSQVSRSKINPESDNSGNSIISNYDGEVEMVELTKDPFENFKSHVLLALNTLDVKEFNFNDSEIIVDIDADLDRGRIKSIQQVLDIYDDEFGIYSDKSTITVRLNYAGGSDVFELQKEDLGNKNNYVEKEWKPSKKENP